jgi:trimethylamine--corrinoid protein Co-methyltransferase
MNQTTGQTNTTGTGRIAQRQGVLVKPHNRLSENQLALIDSASRELLEDPGLLCYNAETTELFKSAGAVVDDSEYPARIRIPGKLLDQCLASAPSRIVLGARNPDHRLILDADEPRVRFGSGSETNVWLDVAFDGDHPVFTRQPGSIVRLRQAAHLCEHLENLDFFIRCVNIQDDGITEANKDVNKFFVSLNNITKHVQAGLTSLDALDDVIRMGEMIAGGAEAFQAEPLLSFITCVIKSPLQVVDDTSAKLLAIARRRVPVVISSCPMAGATGPFDEFGMVAQINAEVLAGVAMTQLAAPGTPVLYGAVPVRTRLDNLNDMYGAPEMVHYTMDCAQMARHYGLPCYSTAAVADASTPGIQATMEKLLTLLTSPSAGAQYVHYAFGLLERTNVFCPEQAILDDLHVGLAKKTLAPAVADAATCADALATIREVMTTDHKTYMYHLPLPSRDPVYAKYPFEDDQAGALRAANQRFGKINNLPRKQIDAEIQRDLSARFEGLLMGAMA